ncbi:MAG: glycine cleavage system protein GcvH [Deltaproteobacteria bacterium]|nr:MAG: glycine cleavage system protein GcvH [Deltaproteobacteria bacterium]
MESEDLKFNEDHIWVKVSAKKGKIGISDYAQSELGEILFIDLPIVGDTIEKDEPFGEVESSKTVSEIIAPVSGTIIGVNEELETNPSIVNDDPYGEGWLIEVELTKPGELDSLLDLGEYERFVEEQR